MDVFGTSAIGKKNYALVNATQKETQDFNLVKGDVLFIRSSVKPQGVGLASVVIEDIENTVYSGFIIRFRPKIAIGHKFMRYCFYEQGFRLRLLSNSTISANTNINQQALNKLTLLIPPLLEQCRIAEVLGVWDESIDLLERLIGKVRSRKQGLMQQLLTGKKRFKEFEGSEWKSYSFSEIVKLRSKKFDPKTSSESKMCVELEHLSQISGKLLGTIDSSKQASTKNYFFTGDVLFGKLRPYLRKYLLAQFDGVCSTEIWVLVSQKYITPNYLFYLVQTSEFIATANVSSGSKMPRADWGYSGLRVYEVQ
jgi:type I restriction enzyme, S subunit